MLSKAFLRSMKHACTLPLLIFYIYMSCSITNAWVVQEWCRLKPAWFGDMISLSVVNFSNLVYINLSRTFVQMLVNEIGLYCIGFLGSSLSLGMRKIFAFHIPFGTVCLFHISVTSFTVISNVTFPPYFNSSAVS